MWIKNIQLKNVKCFADLKTTEFSKGINILIGANNSGKSTILRAISCLQPFETQGDFRATIGGKLMRVGKTDFDINICLGNPLNELLNLTSDFDANKWKQIFIHFAWNKKSTQLNPLFQLEGGNEVPIQTHICNFREPNNFIYPYFSKRKPTEFIERIDMWAASSIEETNNALYAKIDKVANQSFPESDEFRKYCRELFDFEISCQPSQNGKQACYAVNRNTHIPVNSMGEGTINLLTFLVNLLDANGNVFLIEELENDIHPKALKLLLELIVKKSETNQFIISTHNNIVVKYAGAAPDAKLLSVTMTVENRIPTSKVDEIPNTPTSRIKVLEDLGYEVFDFELWKGYLILEESTAETIIRDFLIPFMVPKLQGKLKTIAAHGVNDVEARFSDFHRLFVFINTAPQYHKRAWVAVDAGLEGEKVISRLKSKFNDWPEPHFRCFNETDFENYYPPQYQDKSTKILAFPNRIERQEAKGQLAKEVLEWSLANPEQAKIEFKKQAKEILEFLAEIQTSLGL